MLGLRIFGRELILYRAGSGAAHALGAYCPHLGAHLAHGGRVVGDQIECPFHGWRFEGNGACASVPYAKKIPPLARAQHFPTYESGGVILVYHDAGDPAEPFTPPPAPQQDGWAAPRLLSWTVRSYVQELVEGSADPAHFLQVHSAIGTPTCEMETAGVELRSKITGRFVSDQMPGYAVDATLDTYCCGLGFVVTVTSGQDSQTRSVAYLAPVDEGEVRVEAIVQVREMHDARATAALESAYLKQYVDDFERDRVIWENKIYHEHPVLAAGDGPIMAFRRWARQFDGRSNKDSA